MTTYDLLSGQRCNGNHVPTAWQHPSFPPGQFELGTQSSYAGWEPKLLRKPTNRRNPN